MVANLIITGKALSTNARLIPMRNKFTGKMRLISNSSIRPRKNEIIAEVLSQRMVLFPICTGFDPKIHYFKTSYKFFYSSKEFWTKKGAMNNKLLDAENGVKTVKDIIFDIMGINDRNSRVESVEVSPNNRTFIEITIERRSFDDIDPQFRFSN